MISFSYSKELTRCAQEKDKTVLSGYLADIDGEKVKLYLHNNYDVLVIGEDVKQLLWKKSPIRCFEQFEKNIKEEELLIAVRIISTAIISEFGKYYTSNN